MPVARHLHDPKAAEKPGSRPREKGARSPGRRKDRPDFAICVANIPIYRRQINQRRYYSRPRDWGAFPKNLPAATWGSKSSQCLHQVPLKM